MVRTTLPLLLAASLAFAGEACVGQPVRQRPVVVVQPELEPEPTPVPPPPPPRAAPRRVVRAKVVQADRIEAGVIYARKVLADSGRIERMVEDRSGGARKARGHAKARLGGEVVRADVIYAERVQAGWLEAREVHAREIHIARWR